MQLKNLLKKATLEKIPPVVTSFLLRALVIFVVWQLAYNFLLEPTRIPDKYLTNATAWSTEQVLKVFYDSVDVYYPTEITKKAATVRIKGRRIISVADPCNGLDIYVLFIAFLFCFPGEWKKRTKYIVLGSAYIFVLNTIRCCLILWLNINHRGWVEVSHHYVFTTALYLAVFHLWVMYSKKTLVNATK